MPITVLADMVLPNSVISAGVRGKLKRTNSRVAHGETGFMSINAVSSQALREYELGTVPLSIDAWERIQSFHEITLGGTYGFLIEDPSDCIVTGGALTFEEAPYSGEGGGFYTGGPDHYQLQRRYVDPKSGRYSDRPITRPQVASFQLMNADGTPYAGAYTLDPLTGKLIIGDGLGMTADGAAALSWSGRFYVPVHFQADDLDWDLVIAGGYDQRFLAGPSVVLQEVRE